MHDMILVQVCDTVEDGEQDTDRGLQVVAVF